MFQTSWHDLDWHNRGGVLAKKSDAYDSSFKVHDKAPNESLVQQNKPTKINTDVNLAF